MAAQVERTFTPEAFAAEAMGRRTHEAISGVATSLVAIPEFRDALANAFFGRSHGAHSRNEIPCVSFRRGEYDYLVEHFSSRFSLNSHSQLEPTGDLVWSGLTLAKYDPNVMVGRWYKPVAKLFLETGFIEGEEGEILRFTNGTASLGQSYDLDSFLEQAKSGRVAEPAELVEGEDVFDKITEVFGEIHPRPAVKI